MPERAISACGALVLLGIAYACCPRERRVHVQPRTVLGGLGLLIAIAVLVLKTPARAAFGWINTGVEAMLDYSKRGAEFVFGSLVVDTKTFGFVFAFQVLPTVIVFAALMSALYYVGVMPFVVRGLGRVLARTLHVSGAESFSTVADIFVGQTEAPLVIRPYIARLTQSELMACMTAGFATTAGGVLAAYVLMLRDFVPGIAGHLVACSVMCAPAGLVIAKLMLPETESPETLDVAPAIPARNADSLLEAIAIGTSDGVRLAVNVGAMLIVFLALTALVNALLDVLGQSLLHTSLSLERILGWLLWPLAWLMGIPASEAHKVASLLGQKTVFNEFVAYSQLSRELGADPHWLGERSRVVVSYALCGFANFGSIGVQIGGYSGLAPERRGDLARLAPRAMFAGTLTTCLVACVAGALL